MAEMKVMPKIALGAWAWGNDGTFGGTLTPEALKPVFDTAMKEGLNLWDTAYAYGMGTSEKVLGDFLRTVPRGSYLISDKFTPQCADPAAENAVTALYEKSAELLKKINICFLFAQNYHIAMKYVAPIRKELGIRTVFNILGPLSNPAGANMELMGVYEQELVEPLAQVMAKLGVVRGMVVYGQDKLDEISMSAPTSICEIRDGWFQSYEITPEQFGYTRCEKSELTGGTPEENAQITKDILSGKERGAKRCAVCLNAGAAIYIAGKAASIEEGVRKAEQIIDDGLALKKLDTFIEESGK